MENFKAQDSGIMMFAIGVGKYVDRKELSDIASDPDGDHMFMVDDFNALSTILEMLAVKTCQGILFFLYFLRVALHNSLMIQGLCFIIVDDSICHTFSLLIRSLWSIWNEAQSYVCSWNINYFHRKQM